MPNSILGLHGRELSGGQILTGSRIASCRQRGENPPGIELDAGAPMNMMSDFKKPGRARFLKDRASLDRAVKGGDLDALAAMAAALDPDQFDGIVDVFTHAELPPGTFRYEIRETKRSYVIPTSFALAAAVEIFRRTGRRPGVLLRHPDLVLRAGL